MNDGQANFQIARENEVISSANVGHNLKIIQSSDDPDDGISSSSYRWESSSDRINWSLLSTESSYLVSPDDDTKFIRAIVNYIDNQNFQESVSSSNIKIRPTQSVYTSNDNYAFFGGKNISVPILYTTSNNQTNLTGLTLNVHYNSSIFTPSIENNGISNQLDASITGSTLIDDTNNLDSDILTDKIIQLVWASFDSSFPGGILPASLATVSFGATENVIDSITGELITTDINFTASEMSSGYDFLRTSTTFTGQQFNLDVDGNGSVTALGDGLMIIRKLFDPVFAGEALTDNAISSQATRSTNEIHTFIGEAIDSGILDIDNSGQVKPLEDGIILMRSLLGPSFSGEALIRNAISSNSPYYELNDASDIIRSNINALMPPELTA